MAISAPRAPIITRTMGRILSVVNPVVFSEITHRTTAESIGIETAKKAIETFNGRSRLFTLNICTREITTKSYKGTGNDLQRFILRIYFFAFKRHVLVLYH